MDISKKDITDYAKTQSNAHHQFLNMMCISEELVRIDCDKTRAKIFIPLALLWGVMIMLTILSKMQF